MANESGAPQKVKQRVINSIVIHCSDTEDGDVHSIRKYHVEHNRWVDIGYHFVIVRDGEVQLGRPEAFIGAHCYGHNANSLGICLIGKKEFTDSQLDALFLLVKSLSQKYDIPNSAIKCHYELDTKGKTCPNLPAFLLRKFLKGVSVG